MVVRPREVATEQKWRNLKYVLKEEVSRLVIDRSGMRDEKEETKVISE
jgi:predicted metallo-beta-lactamase superfamily hydrolase